MLPVRPAPFIESIADERYMRAALNLSRRGLGLTYPNPSVAALVVRFDGHRHIIVGRGVTAPGGRPHGERLALQQAGSAAAGATLYVTLEPCNRHSRTGFGPSCTDAIIASGIARVVTSASDPSQFANGDGIRRLRMAGVEVLTGLFAAAGETINHGHKLRIGLHRPLVQLKLAMTADGFAAASALEPVAITGAETRAHVHMMRAEADAIMVGIGTALADDPELTCRLPGLEERSPIRVIMDSTLRLPLQSKLVATATLTPVWVFCSVAATESRATSLRAKGVEVMRVETDKDGYLSLPDALKLLADRGITRLMAEGGPNLANSLAKADIIDELRLWQSENRLITGLPALLPHLDKWRHRPDVTISQRNPVGADVCTVYEKA